MIQITEASIRIRIVAPAHTPGVAGAGLIVVVHKAIAEEHDPREGRIDCERLRRPVVGRLDAGKDGVWDKRRRQRGILHTLELRHRRQPPAHCAPDILVTQQAEI